MAFSSFGLAPFLSVRSRLSLLSFASAVWARSLPRLLQAQLSSAACKRSRATMEPLTRTIRPSPVPLPPQSWNRLADANRALIVPPFSTDLVPKDTVIHRLRLMSDFMMVCPPSTQRCTLQPETPRDAFTTTCGLRALPHSALRRFTPLFQTKSEMQAIEARVLLVASERDRLLPSVQEANRLAQNIKRAMVTVVPMAGHALLLEENTRFIVRLARAACTRWVARRRLRLAVLRSAAL